MWWPAVRASLIAVALGLGGLAGIPDSSPRHLELVPEVLRVLRGGIQAVEDAILPKVRFVPETLQFSQHWKLFSSANDARFLIWVEARAGRDAPWEILYKPHDPEHTWNDWMLEYRRVRGNWNPSRQGPNRGYDAFVTWLARRVFEEEPRFRSVRVRMEEIELLPEGRGFLQKGRFFHERTHERNESVP